MVEGTFAPKYSVPREGVSVPRAVDYADPVLNKAQAGGHSMGDNHVLNEPFDLDDAALDEYMDQIRKNKARYLAQKAAAQALELRMRTRIFPA